MGGEGRAEYHIRYQMLVGLHNDSTDHRSASIVH